MNKPIDMKTLINKLEDNSFSVMTNNARDLGTQIAEHVILEDHTRASEDGTERSDPDVIKAMVDAELKTMVSHMRANATKYIRQRYYE